MSEDNPFIWSGYTGEEHPEICDIRAMPPQPSTLKPGQLSESLIRQYFEEGFLVIKDFFTDAELKACRADLEIHVEELAQKLYKGGKIKNLYTEYDLDHRLVKLEEEWPGAVILLHKIGKLPPSFRELWGNERLLNLMEQLLGPDIAGMPNWNLRTKTPHNEATTVPWHQGCTVDDAVTCEIPYGGMLLFNNFIPHRSLDNQSDHVRWSVDLRFKRPGKDNGMFGLKPDVIMRTKEDPDMKIDWDTFDSLNRTELQMKSVADIVEVNPDQEFDTGVQGPWMRKWEITHLNKHVHKHREMEKAKS